MYVQGLLAELKGRFTGCPRESPMFRVTRTKACLTAVAAPIMEKLDQVGIALSRPPQIDEELPDSTDHVGLACEEHKVPGAWQIDHFSVRHRFYELGDPAIGDDFRGTQKCSDCSPFFFVSWFVFPRAGIVVDGSGKFEKR